MNARLFATVLLAGCSLAIAAPPQTPKKPVTDTYHGVQVVDDFRWLENSDSQEVKAWSEAQNAHAHAALAKLPGVTPIREKLTRILGAKRVTHSQVRALGGKLFALRKQPPKQQSFLVLLTAGDKADRVLVDPNEMDKKGETTIDWFVPSPDGELVAVSLSKGGSESGDVHLFEVATGKPIDAVIPRVHGGTAGGSFAWAADGKGFYYTRYPRGSERPAGDMDFYQTLYFHRLGTAGDSDRLELGEGLPRIAEIQVEVDPKAGRALATVQNGDSGEFAMFLRSPRGKWKQFRGLQGRPCAGRLRAGRRSFAVSARAHRKGRSFVCSAADPDFRRRTSWCPKATTPSSLTSTPPEKRRSCRLSKALRHLSASADHVRFRCFMLMAGQPAAAPERPKSHRSAN